MSENTLAIWGLVVAVIGLAFVLFFKTPKEESREMVGRVNELEDKHYTLNTGFVEFRATVLGRFDRLTDSIDRLTEALEHLKIRTTGEHPIVKPRRG